MRATLYILYNDNFTKVLTQQEYSSMKEGEKRPFKVRLLHAGEECFRPQLGVFTSSFPVFEEVPGFVRISFQGTVEKVDYFTTSERTKRTVKYAVESTGLSFEKFMIVLEKLYREKEFNHLGETA